MKRTCPAALVLAMWAGTAGARTWSVLPDGTGDAPTIQAAVDSAAALDTIELAEGVFRGAGNRDVAVAKALTFASRLGVAEDCTIDCEGSAAVEHRGFVVAADCTFRGITVARAYTSGRGGALYAAESVGATILDCAFTDNTAASGGALAFDSLDRAAPRLTEVSVERSLFARNRAQQSGAVYILAVQIHFTDCTFLFNTANRGGVLDFVNADPSFTGCLFAGNRAASRGGAVSCADPATFERCTFVANSAPNGAHVATEFIDGRTIISHSICAFGETSDQGRAIACNFTEVALTCSNLYGNEGGDFVDCLEGANGVDGNFSADPFFCDAAAGDYALRPDSPCAPDGNPGCGLIGALDVGCGPSPVVSMGWGRLKACWR